MPFFEGGWSWVNRRQMGDPLVTDVLFSWDLCRFEASARPEYGAALTTYDV